MKKGVKELLERHKSKFKNQQIYCNDIEILIDELAVQFKLNKADVRRIIDSEFKMLREMMSSEGLVTVDTKFENFKSLRLIRLGSFRPSERKFLYIQKALLRGTK